MTGKVKLKGKHKRGERGSVEEEQQAFKRANMADEEEVCSTNDKEAPTDGNKEVAQPRTNIEETSLSELKEMLVDIQITISDILRQNSKLTNEVVELRNAFHQQKTELTAVKTTLAKAMKQQDDLETELVAARKKISDKKGRSRNSMIFRTSWNSTQGKTLWKYMESLNLLTLQRRRLF